MGADTPSKQPTAAPAPAETPMMAVAGWLLIAFGTIPLLMGIKGDGPTYLFIGIGLPALGAALVLIARATRRR